jgi:hypothetical protein
VTDAPPLPAAEDNKAKVLDHMRRRIS